MGRRREGWDEVGVGRGVGRGWSKDGNGEGWA